MVSENSRKKPRKIVSLSILVAWTFVFFQAESHAEFAERSVDILESKIDSLQETLYKEKLNHRSISEKLDHTLRTMMELWLTSIWDYWFNKMF